MGMGGIGIWQLVIVFAIVLLLFGGKRLRNLGGDIGTAIKGFRTSMADTEVAQEASQDLIEKSEIAQRSMADAKSCSDVVAK